MNSYIFRSGCDLILILICSKYSNENGHAKLKFNSSSGSSAMFYIFLIKILNGEIHKCMTKTQIHTFKFEIPVQFVQPNHCQHCFVIQSVGTALVTATDLLINNQHTDQDQHFVYSLCRPNRHLTTNHQ